MPCIVKSASKHSLGLAQMERKKLQIAANVCTNLPVSMELALVWLA
jgi:hypothetical protein